MLTVATGGNLAPVFVGFPAEPGAADLFITANTRWLIGVLSLLSRP